jgi:6-phosphofructo-2-kinase
MIMAQWAYLVVRVRAGADGDATNSTVERRKRILERVHEIEDLNVLFLESICTDKKVSPEKLCWLT